MGVDHTDYSKMSERAMEDLLAFWQGQLQMAGPRISAIRAEMRRRRRELAADGNDQPESPEAIFRKATQMIASLYPGRTVTVYVYPPTEEPK